MSGNYKVQYMEMLYAGATPAPQKWSGQKVGEVEGVAYAFVHY